MAEDRNRIIIKGRTYYDPAEHYTKDEIDDKFVEELQDVAFLTVEDTTADANIYNQVPPIVTRQKYYTTNTYAVTFARIADVGNKENLKTVHNANLVAGINEVYDIATASKAGSFKVVETLPEEGVGNVIYLVPVAGVENKYNQYIWNNDSSSYYSLGTTDVDLTNYYTKEQADNTFVDETQYATETKAGIVKVGENIEVAIDGTISAKAGLKEVTTEEYLDEKAHATKSSETYYAITDDAKAVTLIDQMRAMFYPVGSVVMGDNLATEVIVKNIYGGTSWQQITGALYGVGGNNIGNAPSVIGEQMPLMTSVEVGNHAHATSSNNSTADYTTTQNGSGWIGSVCFTSSTQGGVMSWSNTSSAELKGSDHQRGQINISNHAHNIYVLGSGKHRHTIQANGSTGVQVSNGHILAAGTSTYAWKRIS